MPKRGIWQHTRKMKRVMAVHSTFSRNWILRSGFWISGRMEQKGLTNSRNLTAGGQRGHGHRGSDGKTCRGRGTYSPCRGRGLWCGGRAGEKGAGEEVPEGGGGSPGVWGGP